MYCDTAGARKARLTPAYPDSRHRTKLSKKKKKKRKKRNAVETRRTPNASERNIYGGLLPSSGSRAARNAYPAWPSSGRDGERAHTPWPSSGRGVRFVPFRFVPSRFVPFRLVPFRSVPSRSVSFRSVPLPAGGVGLVDSVATATPKPGTTLRRGRSPCYALLPRAPPCGARTWGRL